MSGGNIVLRPAPESSLLLLSLLWGMSMTGQVLPKSVWELEDKEVALERAKTLLTQPEEVLQKSLQWISYADLKIKKEAYSDLAEKVKKYGIIDNPPSYEDFVK